jgi:hypothetical protein
MSTGRDAASSGKYPHVLQDTESLVAGESAQYREVTQRYKPAGHGFDSRWCRNFSVT